MAAGCGLVSPDRDTQRSLRRLGAAGPAAARLAVSDTVLRTGLDGRALAAMVFGRIPGRDLVLWMHTLADGYQTGRAVLAHLSSRVRFVLDEHPGSAYLVSLSLWKLPFDRDRRTALRGLCNTHYPDIKSSIDRARSDDIQVMSQPARCD